MYEVGIVRSEQGHWEEATANMERALEAFRALGDRSASAHVLRRLGYNLLRQGRLDQARERLEEALRLFGELGGALDVAYVRTSHLDLPYLSDRLHLTPAGHAALGDFVAAALR